MNINLSDEFKTVISYARDEAMRTGHYGIGADHLMLAVLRQRDNSACRLLAGQDIDPEEFKLYIDRRIFRDKAIPYYDADRVRPTRTAAGVISLAAYESLRSGQDSISAAHLLLAVSRAEDSASRAFLAEHGLNYNALRALMSENGLLSPAESGAQPKMEDIAAALGEQLSRLFSGSGADYLS
jgi:ATP-dependent Clp protease ATP-binding subunit ClpC